jgi:linoleoyl-CoA desaturase
MFSDYSILLKCIFSFLAGLFHMSLMFNMLHDASHYAISVYPKVNNFFDKLWNGFGLWNSNVWFYHHVLYHHSFTGEHYVDPDLYHLNPFYKKEKSCKNQLLHNNYNLSFFVFNICPGLYIGHILSYIRSQFKNKIFKMKIPKFQMYDKFDKILFLIKLYCLYQGFLFPTLWYIFSLNLWYYINIIFNHDTYETAVQNHYDGDDWLKLQVCNSGNFLNNNIIWTKLFGGINYQIEHHLFPNMSNIHYPTIAPIVRRFCKENNIPYVNHPTLFGAYKSYLKMLKFNNS